jgi:hypothetical protein
MKAVPIRLTRAARRYVITVLRSALAVLGVGALLAVPAGAATTSPARPAAAQAELAGSLGVQLRDVPVAEASNPLAQLYIIDHLHPGTVIHRLIEVSNTTASRMPIVLYPAAATIDNGSFVGAVGHTPNNLSTWTSVSPGASDLRAGGHLTARVTIAVPRDASAGEQYAVVWAETRSTPPAGEGITEISRVGVRIYLSVGAGGPRPPTFAIQSLTARRAPDGRPMVVATVRNTGGLALDMYGALQLTAGPGDSSAGPFPADLGSTLPIGDTEPIKIILNEQLPAGPWNAIVTLHSGLITNSARATITFPVAEAASPPYLALVGIAIALLVIASLIVATRRRRGATPGLPLEEVDGAASSGTWRQPVPPS